MLQDSPHLYEIFQEPWYAVDLPPLVRRVPTVLHRYERQLLYYITKRLFQGSGVIFDGGPFLGGSTVALAAGLKENLTISSGPMIYSFDRFLVDHFMRADPHVAPMLEGIADHADFRARYDQNVFPFREMIRVFDGDLMEQEWPGEPIEVCFIDIAKTWELQDWLVLNIFPQLRPGSILLQQDFFDPWAPYIPVIMGRLREYFCYVTNMEWETTVYICTKPIPIDVAKTALRSEISMTEALFCMDQVAAPLNFARRGELAVQRVGIAHTYGDSVEPMIEQYALEYAGLPRVEWSLRRAHDAYVKTS